MQGGLEFRNSFRKVGIVRCYGLGAEFAYAVFEMMGGHTRIFI